MEYKYKKIINLYLIISYHIFSYNNTDDLDSLLTIKKTSPINEQTNLTENSSDDKTEKEYIFYSVCVFVSLGLIILILFLNRLRHKKGDQEQEQQKEEQEEVEERKRLKEQDEEEKEQQEIKRQQQAKKKEFQEYQQQYQQKQEQKNYISQENQKEIELVSRELKKDLKNLKLDVADTKANLFKENTINKFVIEILEAKNYLNDFKKDNKEEISYKKQKRLQYTENYTIQLIITAEVRRKDEINLEKNESIQEEHSIYKDRTDLTQDDLLFIPEIRLDILDSNQQVQYAVFLETNYPNGENIDYYWKYTTIIKPIFTIKNDGINNILLFFKKLENEKYHDKNYDIKFFEYLLLISVTNFFENKSDLTISGIRRFIIDVYKPLLSNKNTIYNEPLDVTGQQYCRLFLNKIEELYNSSQ